MAIKNVAMMVMLNPETAMMWVTPVLLKLSEISLIIDTGGVYMGENNEAVR